MGAPFMIQSANGALTISHSSYTEGTSILGDAPGGGAGKPIQPNQGWQVIGDPLGSGHYLIVSGACNLCIGIGTNVPVNANAIDDATDRGAVLTLQAQEPVNNHYQLWDFVPPTGGAGKCRLYPKPADRIRHRVQSHTRSGLVVNPRRISNAAYQLWTALDQNGAAVALPVVSMAQLGCAAQGLLAIRSSAAQPRRPSGRDHRYASTSSKMSLLTRARFRSIATRPIWVPTATDTEDYDRDAQWMQFGLFMQNNQLTLFNQTLPPDLDRFPRVNFRPKQRRRAPLLKLQNNTIPAGTRIIMNLCTDQDDFVIGIAGLALDRTGLPIGTPIYWPALGRDSCRIQRSTAARFIKRRWRRSAPSRSYSAAIPKFKTRPRNSRRGMGTITVTASPGIAAQNYVLNPFGLGTAENSNMPYDLVPSGTARLIAQPFGLVPPPFRVIPPRVGVGGLQKGAVILEPGGGEETIPGDAPGAPTVANNQPDHNSPGSSGSVR